MGKSYKDSRYDNNYHDRGRQRHKENSRVEKHLKDALKAHNISELVQLNGDTDEPVKIEPQYCNAHERYYENYCELCDNQYDFYDVPELDFLDLKRA
jgi:hypothetical protein